MGVYTPHDRAGRMKGAPRQTWVYIHRINTRVIKGYRHFSERCIYTAHTHSESMGIAVFPSGVYTPLIFTQAQLIPPTFPQGVYTPLISHGLWRNLRPRRGGKISALGVYTPKALSIRRIPPIAPFYQQHHPSFLSPHTRASPTMQKHRRHDALPPDACAILHAEKNIKRHHLLDVVQLTMFDK